jgi:hypothetical protein
MPSRRQETEFNQPNHKKALNKAKVLFGQTMSPKLKAKLHEGEEWFEETIPELDSKFEFEKQQETAKPTKKAPQLIISN